MDNREYEKILASAERLRLREKEPEPWSDNYSDMNSMEKSMLLDELSLCARQTGKRGTNFWKSWTG